MRLLKSSEKLRQQWSVEQMRSLSFSNFHSSINRSVRICVFMFLLSPPWDSFSSAPQTVSWGELEVHSTACASPQMEMWKSARSRLYFFLLSPFSVCLFVFLSHTHTHTHCDKETHIHRLLNWDVRLLPHKCYSDNISTSATFGSYTCQNAD